MTSAPRFYNRLFTARNNMIVFGSLLVLTPFILLQNFLQDAIGMLSEASFRIAGYRIPYMLSIGILLIAFLVFRFHKKLSLRKLLVLSIMLLMWLMGQLISDYYLDISYYHLQHNWHYIAYGLFAILAYQFFSEKKMKPGRIILSTFFLAMIISTFDETAQIFLSSRVFDISDIAKDLWGVLIGLLFVSFVFADLKILEKGWKIREKRIRDYSNNPLAILVFLFIFAFFLLLVSAALTEMEYALKAIFITLLFFVPAFSVIHLSGTPGGKWVVGSILAIVILVIALSVTLNYNKGVTYIRSGLVLYKGFPVPYLDIMIFENGWFRPVDKKNKFNQADIRLLYKKSSDILIIGNGEGNKGRMGFPEDLESQFVFNNMKMKPLQVIMLPTSEACKVFNRLKRENKKVVFVIHNSK